MRTLGSSLLVIAMGLCATPVLAADMRGTYAPLPAPEMAPPAAYNASGFYLRGDLGISANRPSTIAFDPKVHVSEHTSQHSMSQSVLAGLGVGYQVNALLRGDITGEMRSASRFRYLDDVQWPTSHEINDVRGRLSSRILLANAYVNLGTWQRITPFVGIGVGVASLSISKTHTTGVGPGNRSTAASFIGGIIDDSNRIKPALAFHAGLSYDIAPNWQAELGYRYVHMGTVKSGPLSCWGYTASPAGSFSGLNCGHATLKSVIKNYGTHDLKFGVRYMFAGTPAKAIIMDQPGYIRR
jgi:opacity protein-like surface antigen